MSHRTLIPHPATPPAQVRGVEFSISYLPEERILLRWKVAGAQGLVVPDFAGSGRADNLWQATCFELFLVGEGAQYREFNFSPSHRWAAYGFSGRREGMDAAEIREVPSISCARGDDIFTCNVNLPFAVLYGARRAGVSAVIEEEGGHKSYWALAHHGGEPDFHDPAGFELVI